MFKTINREKFLPLILGFTLILLLIGTASAAVWTDQEDYAPGSVVTISGDNSDDAGYLPGETIVVVVQGPNDYTASCEAVADETGTWSCQVTLWDSELAVGEYLYTATGQISGVVQSGRFSDGSYVEHTCVMIADGSVQCWGNNYYGQLGLGVLGISSIATPADVVDLSGNVAQISGGRHHTCSLMLDGSAQCWGYNHYGQLGNGEGGISRVPVNVIGLGGEAIQISTGYYHTCALIMGGNVQCWGYNAFGQIGNGSIAPYGVFTPSDVIGLSGDVVQISTGSWHNCALISDGSVQCWGYNNYGQLGLGSIEPDRIATAVEVVGLGGKVVQIRAGTLYTCALINDGSVQCWGANYDGQLGIGFSNRNIATPVNVVELGGDVIKVSGGGSHTCAVIFDGSVQCWGDNGYGQLGNGLYYDSAKPVNVIELGGSVAQISLGGNHTCGLIADGNLQCWGRNRYGELGIGDYYPNRSNTPLDVVDLSGEVIALFDHQVNRPPTADASGPYLGAIGKPIHFDGSGSFDPEGDMLTFEWDFGDGAVSQREEPKHIYASAGIYDVCLAVTDKAGRPGTDCTFAVVYNPKGGFVAGGGVLLSPPGAYPANPTLSARANFGFVLGYERRAKVPNGNMTFQLAGTDLNFHADSFDWLVVTDENYAVFQGTGAINNEGAYKFRILTGDGDPDTLRIKIWAEDEGTGAETVIYDNGTDQPILVGSVVIHTRSR